MNAVALDGEQAIRSACDAGDYSLAAQRSFTLYGQEILSFLIARLRSQSDGEEVLSMFAEDLLQALPSFEFRCSVRGYLYTLARNAANRYATEPHRRRMRALPSEEESAVSALVLQARAETLPHKRTETKDRMRVLRERLPEDDQTLLILHVDRNLRWSEIAMVLHEQGTELSGELLTRETARLRKRFERVKSELRVMAIEEGLLKR
jgi:RNA polymerase sigma-70 factor (ECF subfamily)